MSLPPARRNSQSLRRRTHAGLTLLLALAVLPNFGCGREFFRQWADQDVSEGVFEKSRDPRWRLDTFSVEPPAASRFADAYDPDRPPAPPDDYATESMSPTPQWPHHRLMVPMEGTGYLDMLQGGPRYIPPPPAEPIKAPYATGAEPVPSIAPPGAEPMSRPPAPETPSPLRPRPNSGPRPGQLTPNSLPDDLPIIPPTRNSGAGSSNPGPGAQNRRQDSSVHLAAFQAPTPPTQRPPANRPQQPPKDPLRPPTVDLDPNPRVDVNLGPIQRPAQTPDQLREIRQETANFAGILNPGALDFNEASAAALPADSKPYVVGPAQALQLALINSRSYQFQLENIYSQALTLTLNRFNLEPQFFAGQSPITATAGGSIAVNPTNSFFYKTLETGSQNSTLSLGTVAGFGKLFMFGGKLVTGFANQTVFNLVGRTPRQPTVSSFLPLSFVQPFLRGGGRAVTLEPLTQAERNLVYAVRQFARFRQQFFVFILTDTQNVDNAGTATDPSIGYLNVLAQLQQIENDRSNVAANERILQLYIEYAKGSASSGISQLQVDQIERNLLTARQGLIADEITYRNLLDQFKQQLGLPPDVPMILDRSPAQKFRDSFTTIDKWAASPDHDPVDLPAMIAKLPRLENVILDGRPLFLYDGPNLKRAGSYTDTEKFEEFLLTAERQALENRLDLMNNRAQLYDSWRQLAVTANALKGVFNVSITNQILTPPTTSNPFAFVDQAKQFSVVLNTELPLVRVADRNAFRLSLISYRQRQRLLMNQEDNIKFTIRQEIRTLVQNAENFEIQKRNLFLAYRQKDNALQSIVAPPTQADVQAAGSGGSTNQATQTNNLINAQQGVIQQQNALIQTWVTYETIRMALFRDLGTMPFDEWEAFYEFFPANTGVPANSPPASERPAPSGAANPPAGSGT